MRKTLLLSLVGEVGQPAVELDKCKDKGWHQWERGSDGRKQAKQPSSRSIEEGDITVMRRKLILQLCSRVILQAVRAFLSIEV